MKIQLLLASFLVTASGFAQNAPAPAAPKTFTVPAVPPETNTATFPVPRLDWIQRVSTNNAKAQKQADKIQIIFDGDSITDLWQNKGLPVWTERYAKFNAFDFGISSDRTEQVLWRLEHGQVNGLHPKLIVLLIGTNNTGINTAEQTAEGVTAVVAEYQKRCPDAVILLQAIFPRTEKADNPARAKIKAINQIISKLGDGKKVIYVDFGDKFLDAEGTISKEIMSDFTHPTLKGYQIWADAIQPIIDRYLAPAK